MPALEEHLLDAARSLSRANPLTPQIIANSEEIKRLPSSSQKRRLKAAVEAVRACRARGHYGRLRAGILIGTTLLGDAFLVPAERAGIFLISGAAEKGFHEFLTRLAAETERVDDSAWAALHRRLRTYISYEQFAGCAARGSVDATHFLNFRPRRLIKVVLAITQLAFLRDYFAFDIPEELSKLIDELGSPEEVASIASLLVVLANEQQPLDSLDFAFPAASDLAMRELRELMTYGKAMVQQFEVAKFVSLFRYELEAVLEARNPTFILRPPSFDFEYALRLGFIRSQTNAGIARVDIAAKGHASVLSLQAVAEKFAENHAAKLAEIRDQDTEWRRLRLNFPGIPDLYTTVKDRVFYEDLLSYEQFSKDFLIPVSFLNAGSFGAASRLIRSFC